MLAMIIDDTFRLSVGFNYNGVVFITMSPKLISASSPKASRPYRSQLRKQQAEATRTRVIQAAAELFAAEGYARTTLAKIAAAAGVSAETVQGQGPKAALLIAAAEYAAFGVAGEENILNLRVGRDLLAIEDGGAALNLIATATTDVHQRTAQLAMALFGGASADAELDLYLADFIASIGLNIQRVLEVCRERGWLRVDVPFAELVETTVVITSVETFLRITHRDGWSVDAYQAWCRRMLAEGVFRAPQAN
jgi:AcrR family transcriptional regulator